MDTRQMRNFVALAETLHFGHAAARMNMTQPPFSRQIANLERDLGVKLVERNSRHVTLTPAGERFLQDSRNVLASFDNACRDARLVADGQKGQLRLGFMMHAAQSIVPRIVRHYVEIRPDISLSLVETTPSKIEHQLLNGELDAGITFSSREMAQLDETPIYTDRLCAVLSANHPLADRPLIGPEALSEEWLIAAPADILPVLRRSITDYFLDAGYVPRIRFEPQLQNTILRLVAAGLGAALVPESICVGLRDPIARQIVDAPELPVVLKVLGTQTNPAVAPLVEMIRTGAFTGSASTNPLRG